MTSHQCMVLHRHHFSLERKKSFFLSKEGWASSIYSGWSLADTTDPWQMTWEPLVRSLSTKSHNTGSEQVLYPGSGRGPISPPHLWSDLGYDRQLRRSIKRDDPWTSGYICLLLPRVHFTELKTVEDASSTGTETLGPSLLETRFFLTLWIINLFSDLRTSTLYRDLQNDLDIGPSAGEGIWTHCQPCLT